MLDLALFRIRNFAVANLTTLAAYAGLIGGLFFVGLFLQQIGGYSPLEAGLATTPISLILFVLSPRFGRIASGIGPRLPMSAGPIVGGLGLLLLLRVDASASYPADVLPAILVFGLGLAATVAPLTATVLDSVEERHVGVASGANNGISRVAGLFAIAVLGAVISARFGAALDEQIGKGAARPGRRRGRLPGEGEATGGALDQAAPTRRGGAGPRRRGRRLDLGLPPRHRDRRRADDRRRVGRRGRDRQPPAPLRGGAGRRRDGGRRVWARRRRRLRRARSGCDRPRLPERRSLPRPHHGVVNAANGNPA